MDSGFFHMEHKTGIENCYVLKNNKKLRCGYTTGTCAAAAAKAAASMLLLGETPQTVEIVTPGGPALTLPVEDAKLERQRASCAVRKDGGDDPDATDGLLIYAEVTKTLQTGVEIDGGEGVGRVTKAGLWQKTGEAAINRVPREMIGRAVREVCEAAGYAQGLRVVIRVPGGAKIAKKTFNPRLGIEGGISILGTSGIVVPMSEEALLASIRLEMEMKKAAGERILLITPGNYGEEFLRTMSADEETAGAQHAGRLRERMAGVDVRRSMKCSNFVGETVDMAAELGFQGIVFVAHIGKFIKVSGGIMNTHSRCADGRAELMAAAAVRAGADLETARRILDTVTTEEAVDILCERGLTQQTMERITKNIRYYLQHRCAQRIRTEAVLFSNKHGFLGQTEGASDLLQELAKGD